MKETTLDMIHGQLSRKIRERIKRTHFEIYDKLLELGRDKEYILWEFLGNTNEIKVKHERGKTESKKSPKGNGFRLNKSPMPCDKPSSAEIKCYWCGTPGVVRTNCLKCKSRTMQSI